MKSVAAEGASVKVKKSKSRYEGERRFLTLVFADLSGFTAMSKRLEPEDVRDMANLCFEHLNDAIIKHGGTIHKYEGDLVIALFGLPNAYEDDPERAIKSALEMMHCLPAINEALTTRLRTKSDLGLHIGISSGTVFVGEIGSQHKKEYTVMGEVVNLASRLKDTAKTDEILVSEPAFRLTRHLFDYESLPPTKLKGIEGDIEVFKVLNLKATPQPKRGIRGLHSPLVGRDKEFNLLREKITDLQKGLGGAVFILGHAGLGKSRLYDEIKKHFQTSKLDGPSPVFLEGRCLSFGETVPYYPFLQILNNIFKITDQDSTQVVQEKLLKTTTDLFPAEYRDIAPYIGYLFSIRFSDELDEKVKYLDPKSLKLQLFLSVRKLLAAISKKAPHVLIIEDYHWIDAESLALLEFIFDISEQIPILLLCLSRIDKESPGFRVKEILNKKLLNKFTEIILEPLDHNSTNQITDNLLQISGLPQEFKNKILAKIEGNPFYLEEIIRSLVDANVLVFESGVWRVTTEISALDIPDTIQLLISARLDRLDNETKEILQRASVIGRSFSVELLEHLCDLDSLMLSLHLATLEEYEFIMISGDISGTGYKFRHPLIHEVTYNGLLKKKRKELHREVAEIIEELYPDELEKFTEVLAHQYLNSDNVDKAIEWLKRAGNKAKERFANNEAIKYYDQLISVIKDETEGKEEDLCEAYDGLGDVHNVKGNVKKAIEYLTMMCYATKNSVIQAKAKRKIALADESRGGCEEALKMLDEAERLIANDNTPEAALEKAEIRLWRCSLYRTKGETDRALSQCEIEINALDKMKFAEKDKKRLKARGLTSMGLSSWVKGDFEKAIEYYKKSLAIYQELGYKRGLSTNLNNLGLVYMDRGEYDMAMELFKKDLIMAEEIGAKRSISVAYNNMGDIHYYRGQYDKAIELYQEDLKIVEEMGDKMGIGIANGYMGIVYKELADWPKATETIHKYLAMAEVVNDKMQIGIALCFLGGLYLTMDQLDKAEDYLVKAEEVAKQIGSKETLMKIYLALAELQLKKSSNLELAWEYEEKAWEFAEVLGTKSGRANCYFVYGKILAAAGTHQKADEQFKKAVEIYSEIGRQKPLADVYVELARMLKNLTQTLPQYPEPKETAAEYLEKARRIYQALKLDYKVRELDR